MPDDALTATDLDHRCQRFLDRAETIRVQHVIAGWSHAACASGRHRQAAAASRPRRSELNFNCGAGRARVPCTLRRLAARATWPGR